MTVSSEAVVMCLFQAYRLNLFGARYQWLVVGGGAAGWRMGWQVSGCMTNSLLMAVDGAIRLQIRQLSITNAPGVSGRVSPQPHFTNMPQVLHCDSSANSIPP